MIIPGNHGETLEEQTCSHFEAWLGDLAASKNKSTVVWIFRHEIQIPSLTSWSAYCEAGQQLLENLTNMQIDNGPVRMRFYFLLLFPLTAHLVR